MEDLADPTARGDASVSAHISVAWAPSFYRWRGKRLLDLALGIPLLLLSLPIMGLVGFAVLATSGPPVLYASERSGKGGKPFRMWKFRTMVPNADQMLVQWRDSHPHLAEEYLKNFKLKDDPRVTPVGRFLRKLSFDELPQLWAVVCGEMSLVGPRPYLLKELAPHPEVRQAVGSVLPGFTGPWQVQGRNGLPPVTRMQLDIDYASDVRLTRDLKYLLQTIKLVAKPNGD